MAQQGYSGAYLSKIDGSMEFCILLIVRANGRLLCFMRGYGPSGKIEWLFINTGTHRADGDLMKVLKTEIGQTDTEDMLFKIYLGEKIVAIDENGDHWDQDSVYDLIKTDLSFWEKVDFENPPVNENGTAPTEFIPELKRILQEAEKQIGEEDKLPEDDEPRKDDGPEGEIKPPKPPRTPEPLQPEPPHILIGPPPIRVILRGDPPHSPPENVEDEPSSELQSSMRRWRRKRKKMTEEECEKYAERYFDDTKDCEVIDADCELYDAGAYENGKDADNRLHFRYVFGYVRQSWVTTYNAYIYSFIGITAKGETVVLPVFVTAEADKNVPWRDILMMMKNYASDIDYFIYNDYSNIVDGVLAEIFPNAKRLGMIWNLPSDAPLKKRAEEVNREFEGQVKKFWMSHGSIENTEKLQDTVELFMNSIEEFFAGYSYKSALDLPGDNSGQQPAAGGQTVVKTAETSAAESNAVKSKDGAPCSASVSLDKNTYAPYEEMKLSVTGITDEMKSNRAFAAVYKTGAPHREYGSYQYPAAGDNLLVFKAPNKDGDYEMRLYRKDGQYDDASFVTSVSFTVVENT
ncbi:MAG: hypothetical protein LBE57_00740 [Methanosarcinales archaeon]|jgi:hypothetical protein|nr:hypothetical protein [Methanosarcinales archaeon]